ncbi:hypothetical protein HERIO_2329 [Hepatospora eriocheir]|uniref:HTH psq-type domain-containing protein n=1 Tax=Hepatospora eriocheir TaxID=1081669 RepID=A0A1X0Q7A4_9MICR|nr:hypothetical protein HERIO_2329 [Hepatospora eriocheir]
MSKQLSHELLVVINDDLLKGISQRMIAVKRDVSKTTVSNVRFKIDKTSQLHVNIDQEGLKS